MQYFSPFTFAIAYATTAQAKGGKNRVFIKVFNYGCTRPTMIADEKAARQKNHEKQYVFHGFLLFMRQKRVFMKSEVKIIF